MTLSQIYTRIRKGRAGRFIVLKPTDTIQDGDIQVGLCGIWDVSPTHFGKNPLPTEAIIRVEFESK